MSSSSRQLIKRGYTTNTTLEQEARRLSIPLHFCWHKDQFPAPTQDGGYIINLADSGQPGTHWTALWKEGPQYCFFDSFGFPPPLAVEQYLPRYWYNSSVIQNPESGHCGSYCIEFLQYMNAHRNFPVKARFQAFLNLWNENFRKNKRVLRTLERD